MSRLIQLGCVLIVSTLGHSQWTVIDLHPKGYLRSTVNDTDGVMEVGTVYVSGQTFGAIWQGSPNTVDVLGQDVIPYGVHGNQIVGSALDGSRRYGFLIENGGQLIDLTPPTASNSEARAVHAGKQGGQANPSFNRRAVLWQGTAGSWIPLTENTGLVLGMDSDRQVGIYYGPSAGGACTWGGSETTFVDLHPATAISSGAYAVWRNVVAGDVRESNWDDPRACFWNDTATSLTHLLPTHDHWSRATGVHENQVVGWFHNEGFGSPAARSRIWYGSATSFEDLPHMGPASGNSYAEEIVDLGHQTRVVGSMNDRAVMWVRANTLIPPTSYTISRGNFVSGSLESVLASDDDRLIIGPGVVFSTSFPPVQVDFEGTSPMISPKLLAFEVESQCAPSAEMKIEMFNFSSQTFVTMGTKMASANDTRWRVNSVTNVAEFIEPGTTKVKARLSYILRGPVFAYPWRARIDQIRWIMPGL